MYGRHNFEERLNIISRMVSADEPKTELEKLQEEHLRLRAGNALLKK
jgi:hypothetical protein